MAAAGRWRAGLALLAVLLGLGGTAAEQTEEHLKREHSLSKPYQGVGSASSGLWDLLGNAMVMTQFIRLTPDVQSKQGAVWNRVPCYLRDWEMQVHFKIHGQGKKNLNGDGFAIWYTKDRMQPGPVFGSKDNFLGLGVFVDTYPNEEKQQERVFPYISAMVNNGSLTYDHDSDGRPTELGGCTAMVRNLHHDTFLVIRYVKRRLTVLIDIDGKHEWRDCIDVPGVRLPRGYYFGTSSVTGDLSGTAWGTRGGSQGDLGGLGGVLERIWGFSCRQPRHHLAEAVPADGGADAGGGKTGSGGFPARGGQPEAAGNGGAAGAHERPGPVPHRLLLAGGPRLRHRHRHHPLQQVAGAEPQALLLTPEPWAGPARAGRGHSPIATVPGCQGPPKDGASLAEECWNVPWQRLPSASPSLWPPETSQLPPSGCGHQNPPWRSPTPDFWRPHPHCHQCQGARDPQRTVPAWLRGAETSQRFSHCCGHQKPTRGAPPWLVLVTPTLPPGHQGPPKSLAWGRCQPS
uniref:Lectin, mannose binding 2 like n=1 Tax=Geospiza parvula TaxID=87175 RepID=A0A8U8BYG2_GEOPR